MVDPYVSLEYLQKYIILKLLLKLKSGIQLQYRRDSLGLLLIYQFSLM